MKPAGEYVYLNGRIVPAAEARLSPFDIGLLRGYAVFDLLRTDRRQAVPAAPSTSSGFRHSAD